MQNRPRRNSLPKILYQDYLIEVLAGDEGGYWFQCRSVDSGEEDTDHESYLTPTAAESAGKAFIDGKIAVEGALSLEIKWPWMMLPLSAADEYIAHLQQQIGPGHPLYGRQVFPSCIREDRQDLVVQFDVDDDDTYAIVFFSETQKFGQEALPKVDLFASRDELRQRFEQDHQDALGQL